LWLAGSEAVIPEHHADALESKNKGGCGRWVECGWLSLLCVYITTINSMYSMTGLLF